MLIKVHQKFSLRWWIEKPVYTKHTYPLVPTVFPFRLRLQCKYKASKLLILATSFTPDAEDLPSNANTKSQS